ncbi:L-serine ammonia-lyase [Pseudoteredinibacter isoporae]|uniref:L-serine ammonia-lyase n=1 Tax=Pseudoteredinibacter isoporae TaxID=570281 RepID=UPI003108EF6D
MAISVFDLFKVGIGPSSSHTVGPMRAAKQFCLALKKANAFQKTTRVHSDMYGSLGATGVGHGTAKAVILGLMGETPEDVDVDNIARMVTEARDEKRLNLLGERIIDFNESEDLILHRRKTLPYHPNGMGFQAYDQSGELLLEKTYYSVGGGFIVGEQTAQVDAVTDDPRPKDYKFDSAAQLLAICKAHQISISDVMWRNEATWRPKTETAKGLMDIWAVMQECVNNGLRHEGLLPGGLKVKRRAREMQQQLLSRPEASLADPLTTLDWVTLYALAVNEENAAGGRMVTAPTNGAAGIIPAVLHYYIRFVPGANDEGVQNFLLTSAAIGTLYKRNASISGADVGCQGEVGSACSMAAGGLAEVLGGSPAQVENAAEIAMEHNLGLTCDPIGGLVQVPCIERNAMAAIKAIHAARMALRGDGSHFVSLDKVIKTMRDTGRDMQEKYKETSRGGLAVNVLEVPVNIIEC